MVFCASTYFYYILLIEHINAIYLKYKQEKQVSTILYYPITR
jgi:hypothetical protein